MKYDDHWLNVMTWLFAVKWIITEINLEQRDRLKNSWNSLMVNIPQKPLNSMNELNWNHKVNLIKFLHNLLLHLALVMMLSTVAGAVKGKPQK